MEHWLQEVVEGTDHMARTDTKVEGMNRTKVVGKEVQWYSRYLWVEHVEVVGVWIQRQRV